MATYEHDVLLHTKDTDGNLHKHHPLTRFENVAGLAQELSAVEAGLRQELNVAIASKQDKLTFDTTPTVGSVNPVTSGGILTAIGSAAKIASGYYVGNNNNGSSKPTIIIAPFPIKQLLIVSDEPRGNERVSFALFMGRGNVVALDIDGYAYPRVMQCYTSLSSDKTTLSFYSAVSAKSQMNGGGMEYCYTIIG